MSMSEFSVSVPASTANLGPGFDSVGMALGLYMTLQVSQSDQWEVSYEGNDFTSIATGEDNLIVKTSCHIAKKFNREMPTLKLVSKSEIPLGKGFGSSASAIAAGIVIADHVLDLQLTAEEKVFFGSQLEGHADNVAAALLGGVVVSYFDGERVDYIHVDNPRVGVVVLAPPKELATEDSRGLLPENLSHKEATRSSAAGSVLSAALVQNDWKTVGRMMEEDGFHEPFRKKLFPSFDEIREVCNAIGAYGMTISGAGPSLFVAVKEGEEEGIAKELAKHFTYYDCLAIQPSRTGTNIK